MTDANIRDLLATIMKTTSTYTVRGLWEKYWAADGSLHLTSVELASRWAHLEPLLGDVMAVELDGAKIAWYREQRLTQPTRFDRPPSPAQLNREVGALKRCLAWSVERRLLQSNPLDGVALLPEPLVRKRRVTDEDVERLLRFCSPMLKALVLMLFDSGMRLGEAVGVRWSQLVSHNGVCMVELAAGETKTKRARRPRITKRAWDALQALPRAGEYIFSDEQTGRAYSQRTLYRRYQEALEKSGLQTVDGERIVAHTMRHSAAYRWRRSKAPWVTVKAQMGWATDSAAQRYGLVDDAELDDAIREIDRPTKKRS